ncbi:MAG: pyruvate kinase, partial [Coriobacteriia bacterium]|nr:pyruvate kinase [Coriobacteriia bacterium]
MRRTKIVATLGPATDSPEVLSAVLGAGVDVVRLNAAHATVRELATRLDEVRSAAAALGREVGVLVDLPGPKIRVGEVADGVVLIAGEEFHLLASDCTGDAGHACVTHEALWRDVAADDLILIDDGRIELAVLSSEPGDVTCRVVTGGELLAHKGVNVPGVTLSVEAVTPTDKEVATWAVGAGVDWVGQSFVRSAADIESLRAAVPGCAPVVAKIEKHEAAAA